AEASGVDRQDFRDAELGAEVRDARPAGDERLGLLRARARLVLVPDPVVGGLQSGHVFRAPALLGETRRVDDAEELHGVAAGALPGRGIELREELLDVVSPAETEVPREEGERRQVVRQARCRAIRT